MSHEAKSEATSIRLLVIALCSIWEEQSGYRIFEDIGGTLSSLRSSRPSVLVQSHLPRELLVSAALVKLTALYGNGCVPAVAVSHHHAADILHEPLIGVAPPVLALDLLGKVPKELLTFLLVDVHWINPGRPRARGVPAVAVPSMPNHH